MNPGPRGCSGLEALSARALGALYEPRGLPAGPPRYLFFQFFWVYKLFPIITANSPSLLVRAACLGVKFFRPSTAVCVVFRPLLPPTALLHYRDFDLACSMLDGVREAVEKAISRLSHTLRELAMRLPRRLWLYLAGGWGAV